MPAVGTGWGEGIGDSGVADGFGVVFEAFDRALGAEREHVLGLGVGNVVIHCLFIAGDTNLCSWEFC